MQRFPTQFPIARAAQRGMSLVELMVALALGAFLILGVVNVFISNKSSSQVETALARVQENGRIALDLLVADIQDAMYIGCTSGNSNLEIMASGLTWSRVLGFERLSGSWSPALPGSLTAVLTNARVGSDVINLQHASEVNAPITAPVVASSTAVSVGDNPTCIQEEDLVVVSSCSTAHLFRVTNDPACDGSATTLQYGAAHNSVTSITAGYTVTDAILQFFDKTWFVADTGRTRTAANIPVYALYRSINSAAAEEMIEGIEHMQILYGQELASGNLRYVPANDANLDMAEVVSVRIGLLVQSYEPVLTANDNTAYQVLNESIDSTGTTVTHNADLALRRVFKTTAIFRNRPTSF